MVKVKQLAKYQGREGNGMFREMDIAEAQKLQSGQHVWFLSVQGDARRAKVNGAVKLWKRNPGRVGISLKYGMYEYAQFTEYDVMNGRLLMEVEHEQEGNPLVDTSIDLSPNESE